jgi:hypothetical protein
MSAESSPSTTETTPREIEVPAPTAWPVILAFGLTLLLGGLATGALMSIAGAVFTLAGIVGWFRNVLPREATEAVEAIPDRQVFTTSRPEVARLETARQIRRAWLPLQMYPISAGIKGGLAGGVAMAVLAAIYGLLSKNGIWYPINLLAAGFFPGASSLPVAEIAQFHLKAFAIALVIHAIGSLSVGLLYGALLPMLPRHPILLGGVFAPLVWTGLLHSSIGIINPVLNQHVDWFWFVLSQIGFGLVAGLVVSRQERIDTWQKLPLAVRAGIESPGLNRESGEGEEK